MELRRGKQDRLCLNTAPRWKRAGVSAIRRRMSFREKQPYSVLRDVFGYDSFRGDQEAIISRVIEGKSCCVLMPTGSGKSLCYQIPAICREGVGIVISPLIALMQDQVAALKEAGVRAAAIHSGLASGEINALLRAMREGELDLVYVAPERLVTDGFLDLLDECRIALFAIDEAHCISQWGHDFRPEYRHLALLRSRYPDAPCIAVTATADEPTRKDIMERLALPEIFTGGFDRPNIRYIVQPKSNPRRQLLSFLQGRPRDESGIVYCLSRRKTEETASWLSGQGYTALPYHAGMPAGTRNNHQDRFLKEEGIIIVATIAFGMGINKPDVRFVAHMDLPKNIESYYQETGRAGRDGLPSDAWMVYGMQDVVLQRRMIDESDAPEEQKRIAAQKLNAFVGYCEASSCRRQILLAYFGDRSEPCGNCDACLDPPKTMDGTVEAQKLLSCVYRTGQRFGAGYVIDVLRGEDNERIRANGHAALSTYGIGSDRSMKEWQSFLRQLVAQGLLMADMEAHGALKITASGRAFLKEKQSLQLRLDPGKAAKATERRQTLEALKDEGDRELFGRLKTLRLEIAKANSLPPYVIFHDRTLIEMALRKPANLEDLSFIPGVGQSKVRKYGPAFVAAIRENADAVSDALTG